MTGMEGHGASLGGVEDLPCEQKYISFKDLRSLRGSTSLLAPPEMKRAELSTAVWVNLYRSLEPWPRLS